VLELVEGIRAQWGGGDIQVEQDCGLHESATLILDSTASRKALDWGMSLSIEETIERTVAWYRADERDIDPRGIALAQLESYEDGFRP
jgi:CDP-glucose 4,6-dehydratase